MHGNGMDKGNAPAQRLPRFMAGCHRMRTSLPSDLKLVPRNYTFMPGGSSQDLPLVATVRLKWLFFKTQNFDEGD
jgi:hypothetical protein